MSMGMSMAGAAKAMKSLIFESPRTGNNGRDDGRKTDARDGGRRRAGEGANPYLSARRTWNEHMGDHGGLAPDLADAGAVCRC